jgi:hypothetical protein
MDAEWTFGGTSLNLDAAGRSRLLLAGEPRQQRDDSVSVEHAIERSGPAPGDVSGRTEPLLRATTPTCEAGGHAATGYDGGVKRGLALTLLLLLALPTAVYGRAAGRTFTDPYDDAVHAAPDVLAVFVNDDQSGAVVLDVTAHAASRTGRSVVVGIDADRNRKTGDAGGFDYRFLEPVATRAWRWQAWRGARWMTVPTSGLVSEQDGGGCCAIEFRFNRHMIGGPSAFGFAVRGIRQSAGREVGHDNAPDHGRWTYSFSGSPPTGGGSPSITISPPSYAGYPNSLLRSGKPFSITSIVDTTVKSLSVTCSGHVGSRKVTMTGAYASQIASCSGVLPPTSSGQHLDGVMTVRAAGTGANAPFDFEVGP